VVTVSESRLNAVEVKIQITIGDRYRTLKVRHD
jgi:hypothetical protein